MECYTVTNIVDKTQMGRKLVEWIVVVLNEIFSGGRLLG